jgi:hypothetical protein
MLLHTYYIATLRLPPIYALHGLAAMPPKIPQESCEICNLRLARSNVPSKWITALGLGLGLGSLIRVKLMALWGWVRLHTCCTLSNQCAQVKPAITRMHAHTHAHTHTWRYPTSSTWPCFIICKPYNKPSLTRP